MDDKEQMHWMFCTQCKKTVLYNRSGICLACQGKCDEKDQPDSWANMHMCKVCGHHIPFLNQGCEYCAEDESDDAL